MVAGNPKNRGDHRQKWSNSLGPFHPVISLFPLFSLLFSRFLYAGKTMSQDQEMGEEKTRRQFFFKSRRHRLLARGKTTRFMDYELKT